MIKRNFLFPALILIALFAACKTRNPNNTQNLYADSTVFKTDTSVTDVLIDSLHFSLQVLRDQFDEHTNRFSTEKEPSFTQSPITVIFTNNRDRKAAYIKKFDSAPDDYPYLDYSFYKGQQQGLAVPGKLYMVLTRNYGGSGSEHTWYYIHLKDNKIYCSSLFDPGNELSYLLYNRNDSEMVVLNGIWNMKENESHFADHRYKIARYVYNNGSYQKKDTTQTNFKYPCADEHKTALQILTAIQAKESSVLSSINLAGYTH